jgi:hypothetical protein
MQLAAYIALRKWAFVLFASVCAVMWIWALQGTFGGCVKGTTSEALQKTITTLNDTIDLGIKLSITLVGAGTALLVGLKAGVRLTAWVKTLLLIGILFFGQSAIAGVFWRLRLANSWLNECLNLVTEDIMQRLFMASFAFFLAGLGAALIMVCFATWSSTAPEESGSEKT